MRKMEIYGLAALEKLKTNRTNKSITTKPMLFNVLNKTKTAEC